MSAKRICICAVQIPFLRGGAEVLVESLQRELASRGFRAEIVQLPFKWYPKPEILKSCLAWRLLDLTESDGQKIDLVIATKFPSYLVQHPNKVTWLIHQFREVYDLFGTPYSDFGETLEDGRVRELIRRMDTRILPESGRLYTIAGNVTARLARYNGLAGETLYPPAQHLGRYRAESYGDYVLSVGRLTALKRPHLLVEAMQHVRGPARCVVAGEGPLRAELERLAAELGVTGRVSFLGAVPDEELLNLYANALAVCYTPLDEDYGYITVEAFHSRRPVITTHDAGGPLEFVEDGVNGYVVRGGPQEIAARIDQLYLDRRLSAELGERGQRRVQDMTWDRVIGALTASL